MIANRIARDLATAGGSQGQSVPYVNEETDGDDALPGIGSFDGAPDKRLRLWDDARESRLISSAAAKSE